MTTENQRLARSKNMIELNNAKWSVFGSERSKTTFKDLTGQRFGKLVAIEVVGKNKYSYLWRCKCDCGNEKIIPGHCLRHNPPKSCGCLRHGVLSKEMKQKLMCGRTRHENAILEEMENFRKKGFRCISTDKKPVPDFIAIKDGKPYAVEVQFNYPDVNKYSNNNPQIEYADIIWIKLKKF